MTNNINQIIDSLISINDIIEDFRIQREKTELYDSNRFNPFQFMRTNEVGLSKIIAFLLDTKETHGQGDLFLNSFLKYIGKQKFFAYDSVKVSVEKSTSKKRRHDIFIEGFLDNKRCWIISIENKLRFASDQNEQLKDYRDDLERYKDIEYCLIYIPVFKNEPSEDSISEVDWKSLVGKKKAVLLSANDLINWLDNTLIIAPAIKQFCQYLKKFLNEELMGNTETTNELVNYLVKNDDVLYSALAVIDSTDQLYKNLTDILVNQLQEKFSQKYKKLKAYGWKCNANGEVGDKEFGIFIAQEDIYWGVGLQFECGYFINGYYGVYCQKDDNEKLYNLLSSIFGNLNIKSHFKSNKWWTMWKDFDGNLLDWDADILRKIPSGELAADIFELWTPLLDIITSNLDEIKKLDIQKS